VPELLPPGPIGEVRRFEGHGRDIRRLAVSPDGRRALTACWDKIMRLWDLRTGQQLRECEHPSEVHGVAFTADGRRALSGAGDNVLRFWDLQTGIELSR